MSCPKKVAPGTESERLDLPFDRRAADSIADRERSFLHAVEHDGKDPPVMCCTSLHQLERPSSLNTAPISRHQARIRPWLRCGLSHGVFSKAVSGYHFHASSASSSSHRGDGSNTCAGWWQRNHGE
jgi:hypothetical protein